MTRVILRGIGATAGFILGFLTGIIFCYMLGLRD